VSQKPRIWNAGVLVLAVGAGAAIAVLWSSSPADLRHFDPKQVARTETAMWRSYYDHKRLLLYRQLAGLMREQYGMSWSRVTAYQQRKLPWFFKGGTIGPNTNVRYLT
jgi:hypothetical protein